MDDTKRQITKIAREVGKFTVQTMKEEGIGTAEFDVIHLVRHNPGITQTKVRESLKMDKGAAAKRVARLENKGYLVRKPNPEDRNIPQIILDIFSGHAVAFVKIRITMTGKSQMGKSFVKSGFCHFRHRIFAVTIFCMSYLNS